MEESDEILEESSSSSGESDYDYEGFIRRGSKKSTKESKSQFKTKKPI